MMPSDYEKFQQRVFDELADLCYRLAPRGGASEFLPTLGTFGDTNGDTLHYFGASETRRKRLPL